MKSFRHFSAKGFTMVELLVVIAIIGILMTMSASVLRDAGKGRGVESGVEMLESMIQEARATAQGNDTYTRVVIANDPKDTSADSRHLRFMTVQMFKKKDNKNNGYDGTSVDQDGRWTSTSAGMLLPPGVYFSPFYSTPLEWAEGTSGSMIGEGVERLTGKGHTRIYYLEFDEKGRFVSPTADPLNPTRPQRIVLINARMGDGRNAHDGIVPIELDDRKRPVGAKGVVVWPGGDTSLLRTAEQTFDDGASASSGEAAGPVRKLRDGARNLKNVKRTK